MPSIDIKLRTSRIGIALIILFMVCSEVIVSLLPISAWIKMALALIVITYSVFILFTHGFLKHKKSIIKIGIHENQWKVWDNTHYYSAELCGSSTLTRFISILRFQISGEKCKRSCVIFNDAVDVKHYRQIMVYSK